MKTVRATVVGRVQGVGFRVWVQREALMLDLRGWVRNERDGSVSALLSGSPEAVDEMIVRLHRGPAGASVARVSVEDVDEAVGDGFRITG